MSRTPGSIRFVVSFLVVVTGGVAAIVAGYVDRPALDPDLRRLVTVLVALLVLAELRPLQRQLGAFDFTASWAFAAALALVAPPFYALAAVGTGSLLGDALARKPPVRAVYNAATLVVSLALGVAVLDALGMRGALTADAGVPLVFVPACALFAVVVFSTNLLLLTQVLHLETGLGVRRIIRRVLPQSTLDDLLLLAWSPMIAVAGLRSELLMVMPMLGVVVMHQRLRHYARSHWASFGLSDVLDHAELIRHIEATRRGITVVLVELPRMVEIRNRIGPDAVEQVLAVVHSRLRAAVGSTDVVRRSHADRFTLVIDGGEPESAMVVERVRAVFDRSVDVDGVAVPIPASFGVVASTGACLDAEMLLQAAAYELLSQKLTSEAEDVPRATTAPAHGFTILRDLGEALRNDELAVEFQPQVSLRTGATIGFEALVRWRHRSGSTIMPADFVYAAEHTDLIGELTEFVFAESLATCARWWRRGHRVPVSVNVSVRSLTDPLFVEQVRRLLVEHCLPADALEVEYTESALLHDVVGARETLDQLTGLGVAVAIDDFGTGYSSFEHLRRLPVHRLKIDQSFIRHDDGLDSRFVAPMIVLGHNLGLSVVAEGVEQSEESDALRELGCDAAQGWHFARPLPASSTLEWLEPPVQDVPQAQIVSGGAA